MPLSTVHNDVTADERKPELIFDCQSDKGGFDTLNKMVVTYSCKRNTRQWPLTLFFDMLDDQGKALAAMII